MLTSDIAEKIVKETMERLNRNINIMDIEGRIIASGDPSRVGERHEGGMEAIRGGRPVFIDEGHPARLKGALAGVNMPVFFQRQIAGAIGITGNPAEVAEFAELVRMTTELMLQQTFLTSRQEWRNRMRESVLGELIKPDAGSGAIDEQLRLLPFELAEPLAVFVIQMKGGVGYHSVLLRRIEELFGSANALVGLLHEHRICVLTCGLIEQKRADRLELLRLELQRAGHGFRVGCSGEAASREQIAALLGEAEFALASDSGFDGRVIPYAGLEPRMLLLRADRQAAQRFTDRLLPLLPPAYRRTLQHYLDCDQDVQLAADRLFVHKNTVIYRLKKIKERTGYDPKRFRDAVVLQTALWLAASDRSSGGERK